MALVLDGCDVIVPTITAVEDTAADT